ncbi:esterase/lipase family protein [Mycetocola tolaasinivorans]|uniref:esterase/lipase family protein n=1 Tax=Mycetocola tolaasinivorans TaxID=76635 RepID=UPI0016049A1E|nr:alpha/beta hydrolase [Mycetocola tolaasinivorans]
MLARVNVLVRDIGLMIGLHLRAPFQRFPRRYRRGDSTKPVILILPGVYETWAFLEPIAELLHRSGYRISIVRGLGYNLLPIVDTAQRLSRALRRSPVPRSGRIIVAHSKGGLIGKQLMVTDGERLGIHGVVAVATPFAGSRYARYIFDPSLRAFLPTNSTIVGLGRQAELNAHIVSIYGPWDPHVSEGSHLPGAHNVRLDTSGHFRILRAPETVLAVRDAVEMLVADTGTLSAKSPTLAPRRGAKSPTLETDQ